MSNLFGAFMGGEGHELGTTIENRPNTKHTPITLPK